MTVIEASKLVEVSGDDYLEILRMCGGYYSCPKDSNGKRLGPLVGYAGKYPATDGSQKQFVGDIYANFAKAEEYPHVLKYYTEQVQPKIAQILPRLNVFCGAPIGGYSFADMLGLLCDRRVISIGEEFVCLKDAIKQVLNIIEVLRLICRFRDRFY